MRTQHYFFLNEILFITCNADYFCIHTVHAVPQMTAGYRWQNCAKPTFMSNYNLCLSVHLSFICSRCVNNFVFIATSFLIYIICKCTSAGIYFWRISCSFWVINLVYLFHWTQVHGYSVFWIYIIRHWSIHSGILLGMRKISIWLRLNLWANPKIWWSLCLVNIRISEWLKDLILFRFRKYITWFAWSVKHGQSGFFSLHQVEKFYLISSVKICITHMYGVYLRA